MDTASAIAIAVAAVAPAKAAMGDLNWPQALAIMLLMLGPIAIARIRVN